MPLQDKPINRGFSGAKGKTFTGKKPNAFGGGSFGESASVGSRSAAVFSVGDGVMHKAFGQGVVLSIKPMANDQLLEIAFEKAGTKKIMANFAKLEKL